MKRLVAQRPTDREQREIDPATLRSNVLEDMMIQIRSQLAYVIYCAQLLRPEDDSSFAREVRDLGGEILDQISRGATLLCSHAHYYLGMWFLFRIRQHRA